MEKVKLTKQQAEAVEILMGRGEKEKIYVIREHAGLRKWFHEYQAFNNMDTDTLIRALYIGYKAEQTEQEKIIRLWKQEWYSTRNSLIKATLEIVGREDLIPKDGVK